MKEYKGAIYLRLSKEDGKKESSGIESQRMMLMEFAEKKGFEIVCEYCDDGYSGTGFERPGFIRMIKDAEAGKIDLILVKDLSRLGRNYIETGRYTEEFFPENNIRFIAVNDGFDTEDMPAADMLPFRNVINEMYARDISRKIRSALYAKMQAGQFVGNYPPFGYEKRDHKLVIGEAHRVVRRIFEQAAEGKTPDEIADELNAKKILSPLAYRCAVLGKTCSEQKWSGSGVRKIVRNPVYCGILIQGKSRKPTFRSKASQPTPEGMRFIVENTHQPIVSREIFLLANRMISFNRNALKKSPLSGFAYCAICGEKLTSVKPYAKCRNGCLSTVKITEQQIFDAVDSQLSMDIKALTLSERARKVEKITVSPERINVEKTCNCVKNVGEI